jgi:cystathionine gamma-synthase
VDESIANPPSPWPTCPHRRRRPGARRDHRRRPSPPLRQRPTSAPTSSHSAQALGGHSDLLLGVATVRDPQHAEFLRTHRHDHGAIPGALEAFLATRGLRTLGVRLDRRPAPASWLAASRRTRSSAA